MGEYDGKIRAKRGERDAIIKKKKLLREGGTLSGTNMTKREELNAQLSEIRKVKEVKNKLSSKLKEFHASMDELEAERTELLKQMVKNHHTVEEVKAGVKQIEYELTTRTLSSVQESKMIKEIEALKKTESKAKRFSAIDPKIKELRAEKGKLWAELKGVRDTETEMGKKVDAIRAEMELSNQEKNELKD